MRCPFLGQVYAFIYGKALVYTKRPSHQYVIIYSSSLDKSLYFYTSKRNNSSAKFCNQIPVSVSNDNYDCRVAGSNAPDIGTLFIPFAQLLTP